MDTNILSVPTNREFMISGIDLEGSMIERLFAIGVRIDSAISVMQHYKNKIVVQISGSLKIVLDNRIASKIFIK